MLQAEILNRMDKDSKTSFTSDCVSCPPCTLFMLLRRCAIDLHSGKGKNRSSSRRRNGWCQRPAFIFVFAELTQFIKLSLTKRGKTNDSAVRYVLPSLTLNNYLLLTPCIFYCCVSNTKQGLLTDWLLCLI
jgi:hypothetical protein